MSLKDIEKLERAVQQTLKERKLYFYNPYPKQLAFHQAGGEPHIKERLLIAANQVGKTWAAGAEVAMHLTGEYPKWWQGRRFVEPVNSWTGSPTGQTSRDTVQRILLGRPEEIGCGMIPNKLIVDMKRAPGNVPDQIESIMVRHVPTGGTSTVTLKTYDQGRLRWQGETLHIIWDDEEPPEDIYSEGMTRTNATNGIVIVTFTPLLGMSKVVLRFLREKPKGTHVTLMTIEDAAHYTKEEREAILARYPAHERDTRGYGVPMMGAGRVFDFSEESFSELSPMIPAHWPRLSAVDIGYDHATAVVFLAWDRDTDTVHLYDCYKLRLGLIPVHAQAILARGRWIPCVWPHDALHHDSMSGAAISEQYRKMGVNMFPQKATHPPERGKLEGTGGFGFEAGLMDMGNRLSSGRLRVAKHLSQWFEEYRQYHRENGQVVKEEDDLMSATRIGLMMLRHAKLFDQPKRPKISAYHSTDASMGTLG